MARNPFRPVVFAAVAALGLAAGAAAEFPGLTLPPSGDNQRSWNTQQIGVVRVSIEYSSPDVHSPTGEDRRGKIWGGLVPYGMADLGFGSCGAECPWRGGANKNTVFTVSHDVEVQGQRLPAGAYGVHFAPGKEEWTVIFSKDRTFWGSFFYDAKQDALRVKARPEKNGYHEWLTYEFTDRQPDRATLTLEWEDLALPIAIKVPDPVGLYVESLERDLQTEAGFNWQALNAAAQYALSVNRPKEGLAWAEKAVSLPFVGEENFTTLTTLAQLQEASGQAAEARKTLDKALSHRTAGPDDLHGFARQLQAQKKSEEAVRVFELNASRFPDTWPVEVGLARARAAQGRRPEAIEHAKKALAQAPDEPSRKSVEALLQRLQKGEEI